MEFFQNRKVMIGCVILIAGLIMLIAVKGTFRVAREYIQLSDQLQAIDNQISAGTNKKVEANLLLLKERDFERTVFASMSQSCQHNQVNLREIHSPKIFSTQSVSVVTQQVTLQGNFTRILESLQAIQTDSMAIKLSCLRFEMEEINKTQTLIAQVYFQGVKHVRNDE